MSSLEQILTWMTIAFSLYVLFTVGLLIRAILQGRDKLYREKHERFLQLRSLVLDELDRQRDVQGLPRKKEQTQKDKKNG